MKGKPFFFDDRWTEEGEEGSWESFSDREKKEWEIWNAILWLVVIGVAIGGVLALK